MQNNEICIHNGVSPVSLLIGLPESQAGSGRHRCPTCAFEQGFSIGSNNNSYSAYCASLTNTEKCKHGSIAPSAILAGLGENQGGSGRHKCTNCAFRAGFEASVAQIESTETKDLLNLVQRPKNVTRKLAKSSEGRKVDFVRREANNKHLGNLGELLVLRSEIDFLESQGLHNLAKKVRHVSALDGDGLGYDILSFSVDGKEKKIEVKTSRGDINRAFFLTKTELNISISNADSYFIYRLFDFDTELNVANYYVIQGDLNKVLNLEPETYSAVPI